MHIYRHFTLNNTAPVGAKNMIVHNIAGTPILRFPLRTLDSGLSEADRLYRFSAVSDVHITYQTANSDFANALKYVENSDCKFTCICGDLTSNGNDAQMNEYKGIVDANAKTKPVYAVAGNHETIWGYMTFDRTIPYTGKPLFYSLGMNSEGECVKSDENKTPIAYGDDVKDVFIMLGHYGADHSGGNGDWRSYEFVSVEELQWLYETLEKNRNKRCFIFNHVYPYQDKVGDANRLYGKVYWNTSDGNVGQAFISLLKHYKNTILFHGHTHIRFWLQQVDRLANYSSEPGYRSVHIPSLSVPRDHAQSGSLAYVYAESEGYLIDAYEDCIILNGFDFINNDKDNNQLIPIAVYKVDTKIVDVPEKSFKDSTGLISI